MVEPSTTGKRRPSSCGRTAPVGLSAMLLVLVACEPGDQVVIEDPETVERPGVELGHEPETRFMGLDPSATTAGDDARDEPSIPWTWEAPEHWLAGAGSSMRLASYRVPVEEGADAVFTLIRSGGGVRANLDRWRSQFSQPPLDDETFAALPRIEILDLQAPLIEIRGSFRDRMNDLAGDDFALIGAVVPVSDDRQLFLKLVGPEAVVEAERDAFLEFARSLRPRSTAP